MTFLRQTCLTAICALSLGWGGGALANTSDAQAQEVKALFERFISDYKTSLAVSVDSQNIVNAIQHGEVSVERNKHFYTVTVPDVAFTLPDAGLDFLIGTYKANVAPGPDPRSWKMSIATPTPMILSAGDTEVGRMTLGKQVFSGLYDEDFRNFTKAKIEYNDLLFSVTSPKTNEKIAFGVDLVKVDNDFEKDDTKNSVSGNISFALNDMAFSFPDENMNFSMDAFKGDLSMEDYNLTKQDLMIDLLNEIYSIDTTGGSATSAEDFQTVAKIIMLLPDILGKGISYNYGFEGFKMEFPASVRAQNPNLPFSMEISSMDFAMGLDNVNSNQGSVRYKVGMNGLDMVPAPAELEEFDLSAIGIDFDISLNNLPVLNIHEAFRASANLHMDSPNLPAAIAEDLKPLLSNMIFQSGAKLSLNNVDLNFDKYGIQATGDTIANPVAKYNATSDIKLTLKGFDQLMEMSQQALNSGSSQQMANLPIPAAQLYPVLLILKGMREVEKGPNGEDLSVFHFKMDEAGSATVNGTSLDALKALGGLQ